MNMVQSKALAMNSKEIAELTGKRHSDVMRDIRVMFSGLELDERKFARTYIDESNRQKPCYEMDKELTHTLITGYHVKLRNAIVKRWSELEDEPQFKVPQTNG
jgi:Rha family phage regulatory protein